MRMGEVLSDEVEKVNVTQCSGSHVNIPCADKQIRAEKIVSIHAH